ncbi:uncharacterized protein LOC118734934, partial [Rhagoletis pomonella]|uniref:uncharacterized protein LOC118734934 n=1 Tax=Rhagoletis pomonella TaxID=28610 RepID=UPI001781C24F
MTRTRNKTKEDKENKENSEEQSDEADSLNNTIVDMNNATGQNESLQNSQISQQQFTALVASIKALQESVVELRRDNEQLRKERDNAATAAISSAESHYPKATAISSTEFVPGHTATTAATIMSGSPYCQYSTAVTKSSPDYIPRQGAATAVISAPEVLSPQVIATVAGTSSEIPFSHHSAPANFQNQSPLHSTHLSSTPNLYGNVQSHCQYVPSPAPTHTAQPPLYQPVACEQYRPSFTSMPMAGTVTYVENPAAKLYPLPSFSGDPEDWPLFKACYIDTTREFGYNNKHNLIRLQKALCGNAKQKVSSLLIFPDEVSHVLEELEFNFGRPELLLRIQMQKIQQCPTISERNIEQIVDFANRVRNIVAFLKSANCHQHLMSPMLLELLVLKMPASKQFEWSRHVVNTPHPTLQTFSDWLSDLAKVVSLMPSIYATVQPLANTTSWRQNQSPSKHHTSAFPYSSRQPSYNSSISRRMLYASEPADDREQAMCAKCNQEHQLELCRQFKALSVHNRWELVKQRRLFFACLQSGHNLGNCQFKKACGIDSCGRMHNTLLHSAAPTAIATKSDTSSPQDNAHVLNTNFDNNSTCLFKVLPVILSGPKSSITVYAMMDEGSSVTLLEEEIANTLGVRGCIAPLTLQWYNDKQTTEKSRVVNLEIRGINSASYHLKNVRTVEHLDLPTQSFCKNTYAHLSQSHVVDYDNVTPSLLIGLDNSFLCTSTDTIDAGPNQPIAVATKLGWVAYGPVESVSAARVFHVRQPIREKLLHQLVEEFFSIENFGVRHTSEPLESNEVSRSRKVLEETTRYLGDRYEVGLLWHEDNIQLPPSYDMALRRLISVENKMAKDDTYAATYKAEIAKYIDKEYARLLTPYEAQQHTSTTWYLPHFGVVNPNKPGKMRIVFDAAAVAGNTSLNSVLLKGPEHAQSLLAIMYKFRQRQIGVAGDIEAMFSQIKVRPVDRN